MNSKFCTCTYQLTEINIYGERVCAYCGKPFGQRVTVDRALLVKLARLVVEGKTLDVGWQLFERCEQILREYDDHEQ